MPRLRRASPREQAGSGPRVHGVVVRLEGKTVRIRIPVRRRAIAMAFPDQLPIKAVVRNINGQWTDPAPVCSQSRRKSLNCLRETARTLASFAYCRDRESLRSAARRPAVGSRPRFKAPWLTVNSTAADCKSMSPRQTTPLRTAHTTAAIGLPTPMSSQTPRRRRRTVRSERSRRRPMASSVIPSARSFRISMSVWSRIRCSFT